MTQTVNDKNGAGTKQPQRLHRPGQRQQERLQRQQRRRQRQRLWTSGIVAVALIALSVFGFIEYQRYTAQQTAAQQAIANASASAVAHKNATAAAIAGKATATASAFAKNATATAAVKDATATAIALKPCLSKLNLPPTATAGPTKPPAVTGTPVKLPDGLQYIDLKTGCGTAAGTTSNVTVEYTGWLQSNGSKFDSSFDHGGSPFTLQLGQGKVIKGWDEGLVGMKVGGIRRLIIPPSLAYGSAGQSPIPPNATLIFDVQMLSIS